MLSSTFKSNKHAKKWLQTQFAGHFDAALFDYSKRSAPGKNKAKLKAVIIALGIYALGFYMGYVGWRNEAVDYDMFVKFTWIFMVPSSVIGAFSYMLLATRAEFAILTELKRHMANIEGRQGLLWRYEPLLRELKLDENLYQPVVQLSREGHHDRIAPEDYSAIVKQVIERLAMGGQGQIDIELAGLIERNLNA